VIGYGEAMAIEYRTEPEYWEYLDGVVHPKVSPRDRHAIVQTALAAIIRERGHTLGQTGTEWDTWLPDREKLTKFIPDVSFFSFDRLRAMSEEDRSFPPCAPDVAVEVLSPGDSKAYLKKKIALYLSHGSIVVLDVDPLRRTIAVHDGTGSSMLREGDLFAHSGVPWLSFDVRDVFADLDIPDK
jgi:Uma2 family endonuclease